MSSVDVKQGETVDADHILGATGNTGHSSGPHLHYEVGTVSAKGAYTPNPNARPDENACPLEGGCANVTSRPAPNRCLTIDGKTTCRGHMGTDIAAHVGTEVTAPTQADGGTVVKAGWQEPNDHKKGFGQRVTIDVVQPDEKK